MTKDTKEFKGFKVINTTDTYREIISTFDGIPIFMRHYFAQDAVHIRVDEGFARANGLGSLSELYKAEPLLCTVQWLDAEMLGRGIIAGVIHDNKTPIN